MGTEHNRKGGLQPHEPRQEKQEEILRLLRSGMTLGAAAKRAGVAKSTALNCARRHDLTNYARGKAGAPGGSARKKRVLVMAVVNDEPNYRAIKASLRWGSPMGGGW